MALSRVKVWGTEILTAADLNAEFDNILNNASSLISPLSGALDWDGYAHTLDAAGVTTAQSTTAIGWSFSPGSKSGTPGTTGGLSNWAASTWTDNNTAASGTATNWVGHAFQRPTVAASNASVTTTNAATVYIANSPSAGTNETLTNTYALWIDDGITRLDGTALCNGAISGQSSVIGNLVAGGHLYGLTLSNSSGDPTNDIDIAAGDAASNDATSTSRRLMVLASGLTKQLDAAWAVGTNQGMLDTGAIANGTYHIFLIMRSDTGVVDVLASTSATSPTMPTNYDFKRRIGSILRESAAIVTFSQVGDSFLRSTAVLDIDANNPGTSAVSATLSIPTGITVDAGFIGGVITSSPTSTIIFSSLSQSDQAPSATLAPLFDESTSNTGHLFTKKLYIRSNTTRQIRYRVSLSDGNITVRIATFGWIDTRGRLS